MNDRKMLIGGELVESSSGRWMTSYNPVDESVVGRVPEGTADDVARAAQAANAAAPAWGAHSIEQRAAALRAIAVRIEERFDEILAVEVADTGNTEASLRGDLGIALWSLRYYAGLGYELKGESVPATAEGLHFTIREPYGVVGRIVPFNHPFMFAVARTAAALMAGNCVLLKPPETSSLSAMLYGEICRELLPAGVMNIVSGYGDPVGEAIARSPLISRIAFIGSATTGRRIQKAAADISVKTITLELGGKNPMIVYPDADFEAASAAAVRGMNFVWSGQSCGSTSRLLVHESLYDRMVESVGATVGAIKVGPPSDATCGMGPMNSRGQADKALRYMQLAREGGARLVCGGSVPAGDLFTQGYWVQPTVFADVTQDMRIAQEEVFGPVLSILRWSDEAEVLEMANDVEFGLTASIWTRDIGAAMRAARAVKAGYLWINGVGAHFPAFPYGGYKNSGVGRDESLEELLSYTQTKAISILP